MAVDVEMSEATDWQRKEDNERSTYSTGQGKAKEKRQKHLNQQDVDTHHPRIRSEARPSWIDADKWKGPSRCSE